MGGRLRLFLSQWRRITDDVFVLSVVAHGFIISPSQDFPGVLRLKTITPRNPLAQAKIEEEVASLLQKCAIVKVDDRPHLSLSPIFVILKKYGGLRVILNLKRINVFIPPQHFRMESLAAVLPQLLKEDWAVTLDLQDAYLHVPIHPSSRHLLCFAYKDQVYQYQVLPFGLKDSPWVFTRLVAVLIVSLRQSGIRIFHYLDDWLLVANSRTLLVLHLQKTLELTQRLGFLVNLEKSSLTPSQIPSFLGASLDIPRLLARPLPHRVEALQSLFQEITAHWFSPAKTWQVFLGHLASFTDLIPLCRLFMRPLQLHFLKFCSPRRDIPSRPVPLSPQVKSLCLLWGSQEFLLQGKSFSPPPPRMSMSSDASNLGWGAFLHPYHVSGVWSQEARLHINLLELLAVFLALQSFEDLIFGQSILIRSDNSMVVSYINHQGGTHSPSLCNLTLVLWDWCRERGIHLSASHVPGEDNLLADFLSRG